MLLTLRFANRCFRMIMAINAAFCTPCHCCCLDVIEDLKLSEFIAQDSCNPTNKPCVYFGKENLSCAARNIPG